MSDLLDALNKTIRSTTKDFEKQKKRASREERLDRRQRRELQSVYVPKTTLKEAAFEVMEEAYNQASSHGHFSANARQIMYKARPLVMALTDDRCWKGSSYFTQHLLPDFMEENPSITRTWNVVFDARGRMVEPHSGLRTDLGTAEVRAYIELWRHGVSDTPEVGVPWHVPTLGPAHRYEFALFVEKEGFYPQLKEADIASRFDIAIMSTKGMSVTAARELVEHLSKQGVTILALHDFDKWGLSILHTLRSDTRRYTFHGRPNVVDIGLRLPDVEEMNLSSETVNYHSKKDPSWNLRESGATEEEIEFLVDKYEWGMRWTGKRVELNAMSSEQFIEFVERKLKEHGVEKIIPNQGILENAYRRAYQLAEIEKTIRKELKANRQNKIEVPDDLEDTIRERFKKHDSLSWDEAIRDIVRRTAHHRSSLGE